MTDTLEKETIVTGPEAQPTVSDRIAAAIAKRGVNIEPHSDRMVVLTDMAQRNQMRLAQGEDVGFKYDGLFIFTPVKLDGKTISSIDFLPTTKRSPNGASIPQRGEVNSVVTRGLEALQNYVLLVDSGFLVRPDRLEGLTNPTMENLAKKRLGFAPVAEDWSKRIGVDFDVLADKVFSPETDELMVTLDKFQQTRPETVAPSAGQVALSN